MIKYKRYEVSRLADFHLSFYECVGILTHLLATSENKSAEIDDALTALVSFDYWTHGYPSKDKTRYIFEDKTTGMKYTALFYMVDDDYCTVTITKEVKHYLLHPDPAYSKLYKLNKKVILAHTFTDDELMDIIDYSTYEDDMEID